MAEQKAAKTQQKAENAAKTQRKRSSRAKTPEQTVMERLIAFGKEYQIDADADFLEAAASFAAEAALIGRMRERIDQEGLTISRETKGGTYDIAHPLLTELPRHITCANNTLGTIAEIIMRRGAKKEPRTKLAEFRLQA